MLQASTVMVGMAVRVGTEAMVDMAVTAVTASAMATVGFIAADIIAIQDTDIPMAAPVTHTTIDTIPTATMS